MPLLGFGTWTLRGELAVPAVRTALECGYRHVDTATMYGNESDVGRALRESGVPRDRVFLTTKCPPSMAGRELATLEASLARLGVDQVDLWLVHSPVRQGSTVDTWRAFVEARDRGWARDIGVSNFDAALVDEVGEATGVVPAVNQIEWSPLLYRPSVVQAHRTRGVVLEGYSGLRGGILDREVVTGIAADLDRTPAQVVLRWHLQHGVVVIPRSAQRDRIRSNADLDGFELSPEQMDALDALGRS
jgi:diketogulonate reductase-like aldo/keto reductase